MELEESLDLFLSKEDEKVFLLRGLWGVGKTTSVNNWINKQDFKNKVHYNANWKVVKLSLFGVSDVNQLNTNLLYHERDGLIDHL